MSAGNFLLHGSLNWVCCDACHVLVDLGYEVVGPLSRWGACGERRARPLLIRPTVVKDFRHRVWQDVCRQSMRSGGQGRDRGPVILTSVGLTGRGRIRRGGWPPAAGGSLGT